jgi:hypothetical protein
MPTPREILISHIAHADILPPGKGYNDYDECQRWNAVAEALDAYVEEKVREILAKDRVERVIDQDECYD